MRQHGIIHPHMLQRIQPNFYPSVCDIQQDLGSQDDFGQVQHDWVDVDGLTDIHCRISPRGAREVRSEEQVYAEATHHIALGGYYPDINESMQIVVDGVPYSIEGVEWDGNRKTTRVFARLIDGEAPPD